MAYEMINKNGFRIDEKRKEEEYRSEDNARRYKQAEYERKEQKNARQKDGGNRNKQERARKQESNT